MNSDDQKTPSPKNNPKAEWITELAQAIRLREGAQGIIRALWALQGGKVFSTRDWSGAIQIPVPVLAALRRELEKRDLLVRDQKIQLTDLGKSRLVSLFGQQERIDPLCPTCAGTGRLLPPEAMSVLDEFQAICEQRPTVDVTLDQSHATPETGIRKALFLLEKGLLGNPLFFMGDDDLISIACLLVRQRFMPREESWGPLFTVDLDERYLTLIQELSQGKIQVRPYDVRDPLPNDLQGKFSVALTDPAYTENGITAFSYRCLEALEESGTLLLSMPFADGPWLSTIQKNLVEMGFTLREIHVGFNRYHGASIHANRTNLIIGEKVGFPPEKTFCLRYTPLYTGEVRPPGSVYACTLCDTGYRVGPTDKYQTIHDLKKQGCGECGNNLFRRLSRRDEEESERFPDSE